MAAPGARGAVGDTYRWLPQHQSVRRDSPFHRRVPRGLAEAGFIDGKNVAIEFRFAEQRLERVPALAMDLVRRQVAVIFTAGGDVPAMVAKGATSTIPIVFVTGFDPVLTGLVASLNRPSGNVTGATVIASQLAAKRLELIRELAPRARVIAMVANPSNPNAEPDFAEARLAARAWTGNPHVVGRNGAGG